ncbi:MAG: hypothetical protein JOZ39_08090 [Chloroflexi bacterium]|nr:hypothetical protein [Chloroflexota bacterium]
MGQNLVPIGQVQVQARQRDFAAPTPSHPLTAQVGDGIELLGYDLDRDSYSSGATAHVTLYWRAVKTMDQSYTEFIHVLDSGRHVVAQADAIPGHGQLPTTAWTQGEVITDRYDLPLKGDLAAGTYQLEAGFYRGDTGVRLKATSVDVKAIDDGLLIGPLEVK